MAAKRAARWGIHYLLRGWGGGVWSERSSFVVRGRTRVEAEIAARKHPEHKRRRGRVFRAIRLTR